MKRGIHALFIATTLISSLSGYHAFAAPAAVKGSVPQPQVGEQKNSGPRVEKQTTASAASVSEVETVNINTATAEELAHALNGVGDKKAQAIISYREEYGPFKSVDDLKQVPGISNGLVERNMMYIRL